MKLDPLARVLTAVTIALACAQALLPSDVSAQRRVGIHVGHSSARVFGRGINPSVKGADGVFVGGFISEPIAPLLHLTSGVYYIEKGSEYTQHGYLEVPALLSLWLGGRGHPAAVSVWGGVSFSGSVRCRRGDGGLCTVSSGPGTVDLNNRLIDIGTIYGATLTLSITEGTFLFFHGGVGVSVRSYRDAWTGHDERNRARYMTAGYGWFLGT